MERTVKKTIKCIIIIIAAIVIIPALLFGGLLLFVPISRSNNSVRNYVLGEIPMGTSWDNAVEIIEKKQWQIEEADLECGLHINYGAGNAQFASSNEMLNGLENADVRIVGSKAMFVELGEYYGPFNTIVFAYLAFNENDELAEVVIRRDIDSL